jgi:hypothetical protein
MADLRTFGIAAAVLAFLSCNDGCKNNEPHTSDTSLEAEINSEIKGRVHDFLEYSERKYKNEELSMSDYLTQLKFARTELEKIGDTKTADYVVVLTRIASIYRATALNQLEGILPEVNLSEDGSVAGIKRKDSKNSRMDVYDGLMLAKKLYEEAVGIIKDPNSKLSGLSEGSRIAPFYGLGWTCRVLRHYDCSRTAFQEGLGLLSEKSPYKKRFTSALDRLANEEKSR